ncbi:stage III sporulation protein AD [Lachnoclostridium sp. An196]|uniref:SpoIIIAC/SpoIIIAD family protein n=1 Tax=Lachnoclostridium sp. An196 TaxID=1965583 RepID=UPI000B39FCDA|nr:SpoIIIAC/SpoIIIAD family protein [Lachnoclostridium sp. An196]OUP22537.1 stage III sporulation protein AD [Lachnoclostridium sp. An196]HIS06928.1 stage III sporulation protein AD [Candidatus Choladocola avistercoris]
MVRVALLGIAGVLLALQLKSLKSEYSIYLCLGVSALIFWYMTEQLGSILEGLEMIQDTLPLNAGYIRTLIKIVGITYIAEFASDLCKDAGYQAVAGQIQMFGKLSVLAVSIPILTALLDTVRTFLGG